MRILVVSDSHGDIFHLMQAVREQPRAEVILHLGDGEREAMELRDKLPAGCTLIQVRGNNDWGSRAPLTEERVLEGKRLFFTHGHLYHVKYGYREVISAARQRKADILLFGHTHSAYTSYEDGMYIMNPGTVGSGWQGGIYGVVDITPAGIVTNIIRIKN